MTFSVPTDPVDQQELTFWMVSATNRPVEMLMRYHVVTPWVDIDEDSEAPDAVDTWVVYADDVILPGLRYDGWASAAEMLNASETVYATLLSCLEQCLVLETARGVAAAATVDDSAAVVVALENQIDAEQPV